MILVLLDILLKKSDESEENLFMDTSTTYGTELYVESLVTSLVEGLYPSNTAVSIPKLRHLLTYLPAIYSFLLHLTDHSRALSSTLDSSLTNLAVSTGFNKCVFETDMLFAGLRTPSLESKVG